MTQTSLTITIDIKTKQALDKRAKKELMTTEELVSDIVRRSVLSYKGGTREDKIDDAFVGYFSRKNKHRKKKAQQLYESRL